tara:strand:+ start:225 stop:728 length:504 start_codon:yes stop_codon:yes gene_type:complete
MKEDNFNGLVDNTPVFYMGIDCSSRAVHAVVLDFDERIIAKGKWFSTSSEFINRFPEMLTDFDDNLSKIKVTLNAAVESAIFIQNPKSTIEIASVVGAVNFICTRLAIECTLVDNRHWKKIVLGKGNLNKKDIKAFAVAKWGDVFPEQDYADAACIALWNKRRSDNG